tara:strand:+ start:88 stop:312 length:225 start_codon:yes stop_codon:yes gene_type:complete
MSRGRPTTRDKGLRNGFYIELRDKSSSKPVRIMRESHEQAMLALTQFQNKIVKYLGEVKDNYWVDGDNKGKKVV